MYQKHKIFEPELSDNTRLWRYLDFTKYVSMLSTRSLFFVRLDKLEDRWEGKYPKKQWTRLVEAAEQARKETINQWERYVKNAQKTGNEKAAQTFAKLKNFYEDHPPSYPEFVKYQPSWTAASCWHENEHESAALWRLYLTSREGIAVESDFGRIKQSFADVIEDVFIGRITYINYDKEEIPRSNLFCPLMTKRKSFQHENEVRAVIWRGIEGSDQLSNPDARAPWNDPGELIPVNMDVLIRAVYVAPGSPKWFVDIVKNVTNRYGFEKRIEHSIIDEDPIC